MKEPVKPRQQTARDRRLSYRGSVRLLIPFPPWRLLLTLSGLNLSSSGVLALLPADIRDADAVRGLLAAGDAYDLQLEHGPDAVTAPFLAARLVRTVRSTTGYELAFAFDDPDTELLGLLHELAHGTSAPSPPV